MWLDENYQPVRDFAAQHNVQIYVGESGMMRWAPDSPAYLHDLLGLYDQYGWNHAVYVWRSDEPGFDGFNLEYGPDPDNHSVVPENPLLGVLQSHWAQNTDFPDSQQ